MSWCLQNFFHHSSGGQPVEKKLELYKICAYIRQLKRAEKIKGSAQFKEELRADLKEALREVEDVKNGKSQFMSMNELYAELEETK